MVQYTRVPCIIYNNKYTHRHTPRQRQSTERKRVQNILITHRRTFPAEFFFSQCNQNIVFSMNCTHFNVNKLLICNNLTHNHQLAAEKKPICTDRRKVRFLREQFTLVHVWRSIRILVYNFCFQQIMQQ